MLKPIITMLTALMLFSGVALAQQKNTARDTLLKRAARIEKISGELFVKGRGDEGLLTKEYVEARIGQIRDIVQEHVIDTLGQSDSVPDVRSAVTAMVGAMNGRTDSPSHSFVYKASIQGFKTFVIAYNVLYGGQGIPSSRVVIQGYKKTGTAYEFVANTGEALKNCGITLDELTSPRPEEAWFLAHGQLFGPMEYQEVARIYSFDGYQFRELWAPSAPLLSPDYSISADGITVKYSSGYIFDGSGRKHQERKQDTIQLVPGGPVVSTVTLQ